MATPSAIPSSSHTCYTSGPLLAQTPFVVAMAPLKQRSSVDPLHRETPKLNILLTNGRFPVALDLARQLHQAGHTVYCVDPRGYPIARFSRAVEASAQTPAPHDNPDGYLSAIKKLVVLWKIDMIVPVHEELLSLADSDEPEILSRLFAPSFKLLLRLHEKYSFTKYMHSLGLAVPTAWLCKSMDDVINLPTEKFPGGLALRPCLGEAAQDSYHLRSGEPLPELDIGEHKWYVAQELISGIRYCSYSIVRKGSLEATGVVGAFGQTPIHTTGVVATSSSLITGSIPSSTLSIIVALSTFDRSFTHKSTTISTSLLAAYLPSVGK